MAKQQKAEYVDVKQGGRRFVLTKLPASAVARISYAAVRGQSGEQGAIQRVLNTERISSIKAFTLGGGDYPNAIVLNWVSQDNQLQRKDGFLTFTDQPNSAQIIDGQHRVAGIRAAIEERPAIGKMELPVVIYERLSTQECADIFLSINTEQKPVPRSLVFDLYGVASTELVDPAAVRARDIATFLDEMDSSPYCGEIKFPGAKTRKGGIALSTAVTAIKPLVEDKGAFEQIEVVGLELQRQIILNLFVALKTKYGDLWEDKSNAFLYAAGFMGAMDFLRLKLIPYCSLHDSFTVDTISDSILLSRDGLILQSEIKGLGGAAATRQVYDQLVDAFKPAKKAKGKKIIKV
jgi:DGQHR domain-containing protein